MSHNEIIQGNGKKSSISQLFYLDFDGQETSYVNRDLGISIDDVTVEASGIDSQQVMTIVNALNTQFSGEALFTSVRPDAGEYSTIYIGLTSAFDAYGQFQGIAETVDAGNKIHDDNAFVLLDASARTELVTSVIAHEAGHLLGNNEHGGEGLKRYALDTIVSNGQVSSGVILQEWDYLRVSSGGTANDTIVNDCGEIYVYEGGTANNTTVNNGGWIEVYSGGTAHGGAINSGGTMWVSGGGAADEMVVSNGGRMRVFDGATASGLVIEEGGAFDFSVAPETYVQWTSGGSDFEIEAGFLSGYVLNLGSITVAQDGMVEGITVNSGGELWINDGSIAMQVIENGGFVYIEEGAEGGFEENTFSGLVLESNMATVHSVTTAVSTTLNYGGVLTMFDGGIASGVAVNKGGVLEISSGGIASEVLENGGCVWVYEGASATFLPNAINNLELGLKEDDERPMEDVYQDKASLHSGTTATSTTLYDGGALHVCEGGIANNTIVSSGAELNVYEGGLANGITANDTCWITLWDGATVSGQIDLNGTSEILVKGDANAEDAVFNFHFDTQTPEDDYLLFFADAYWYDFDGVGNLLGGSFVITIGSSLDCGVYKFIAGAMDFDVTFTVQNADSQDIGELKANGGFLAYNGFGYSLEDEGGNITLRVVDAEETDIIPPVISNIAADVTTPTNGTVTVTATASDNSGDFTLYYIKDGGTLTVYEEGVAFTANGSVIFKAIDAAGNETISDEFVVSNIDTSVPVISSIVADVATPTKGTVKVTATASDNSGVVSLYYSKDGGDFTAYENGVEFTANGSVVFKAVDAAGNETISDEFVVSNIDTVAPVISDIAADVTEPTNGTVTVTATASDNSGVVSLYYSKNGGDFVEYEDGVAFTANGNVVFKAVDAAGNETLSDALVVENIDTTAPAFTNIAADVTEPTKGTVKVTATASDNSGAVELFYSKDGDAFTPYEDGVVFTANGNVIFKAIDAAGNQTNSEEYLVENIDTTAPVIDNIVADVTEPTNGTVTVTASVSDDSEQVAFYYSKDGGNFVEYENGVEFTANGKVVFKAVDAAGNETLSDEYEVTNIDTVVPVISNIAADVTELTNEAVTVTATASDDSGEFELYYSKDGGDFVEYEEGVEFTENGSVVFKVVDAAGNETLSEAFVVSNIDKTAPVFTNIAANVTEPTKGSVKVTATASDDSGVVSLYYSKDGDAFTPYEDGVVFTANGSVVFKAIDAAGNQTNSEEYLVENIDTTAPVIDNIVADVTEPTNGTVTVTASVSDDSEQVAFYYSKDGGDFVEYEEGVEFTANGKVVFKAVDAAGNETLSDEYEVTNIDTVAPLISNIAADVTEPTNEAVTVTATASDDSGEFELYYSKDGGDFAEYENGVEFTANGSVVFKAVDAAGNETVSNEFVVSNIDTSVPVISNIAADVTAPTQGSVTVTATASDDSGVVSLYYSKDGGNFTAYENGVVFTANGSVVFKAVDEAGNETVSDEFVVGNIDTVAPVISNVAADVTAPTNGTVTVTATASDDSGVVELYYSKDGGDFVEYEEGVEFTANGSVVFKAVDAAGNETSSDEFVVSNIDTTAPGISDIAADVTEPTKGSVTVTATASDDSGVVELYYSKDEGEFIAYQDGVEFTANGSVVFKAVDAAGNETLSDEFEVTNIDTSVPVISDIAADVTEPTNGTVTVTASASDDSGVVSLYYSKDGGDFTAYENGVEFTSNGSVVFKAVDEAGNETVSEAFVISNIDTNVPVISNVTADVTEPTNETVTVTATASDDSGQVSLYYSQDGGDFTAYEDGVEFTANGSVVFKAVDAAGNETSSDEFQVTNIDTVKPVISDIAADVTVPTNGAVTVTATASDDSGVVELYYSKDDGDFTAYENGVEFIANGSVVFKAVDEAGNETLSDEFAVTNIDNVAPVISDIAADVTAPTNGAVKVTATASDDSGQVSLYYSKDGGDFTAYENGVEFIENGSVVFKAVDAVGNEILSDVFNVLNIDTVVPIITSIVADVTAPTNGTVKVTATAGDDSGQVSLYYAKDGGVFTAYENGVDFTANGSVVFKALDAAGNEALSEAFQVANIDTVAPLVANLTIAEPDENNDIAISIEANEALSQLCYSWNDGEWTDYPEGKLLVSESGSIRFRMVDLAGNETITDSYPVAYSDDDWTDMATKGNASYEIGYFGEAEIGTIYENEVGKDDLIDYMAITLQCPSTLSFTIDSANKTKFSLMQLQGGNGRKYSLKSIVSGSVTKPGNSINVSTANPLGAGTYYICMQATDKKAANAPYTITLNDNSIFYSKADNRDDWTRYDKKRPSDEDHVVNLGTVSASGPLLENGWVGVGDLIDYSMFTLDVPASIVLNVTTTDKKSKVRLYSLKQKSDGKYGLKSLCSWTPKFSNMTLYTGSTKMQHLEAGTYYISVESTDKKKGNADYSISIDNQSRFYTKADNSDDLPKKKMNTTWAGITADLGTVNATGMLVEDGWVGFCDATDVAAFTLDTPARISFDVTSSDMTKFKLCQVKDLNSDKAKVLQTINLTHNRDTTGQYVGTSSKPLKLMAGTYYIYMESTTAKKGGSADYTISVTNDSIFYTEVDNSDDLPEKKKNTTWADITADLGTITAPGVLVENGWVGFGDETDVASFTVEGDASISFDLTASDKAQFFVYQVKDTNTYNKKSLQKTSLLLDKTTGQYTATTKLLKLKAGTYYISMESSNAKSTSKNSPGNAYYSISVNGNSVLPNTNQDFGAASPNDNLAMDCLDFQLEETGNGSLALEGNAENNIIASLEDSSGETALPQLATFGNAPEYANNLANGDCSLGISNPDEQKYNDGIGMAMLA